ncbi:BTAD domain-containing putative transcriptional regulator [Micromonospora sonneratiae]|uniref:BTAD domain-containing putative transcriptional regulator n=1 Tax=Micromonospora sonneratiae TaxID=1184706 RepID=A0ABW3YE77_9ACTN
MAEDDGPSAVADIRLLGPLEVSVRHDTGRRHRVVLGGPRQRTLFGLLALRAPEVVSRPYLIDGIWGEDPPPSSTKTLHAHVAYARRALTSAGLSSLIVTRPPGYALAGDAVDIDVRRFEDLVTRGRRALRAGATSEAAESLRAALRLWRGDVLADCPIGEWARAEAAMWEEARRYAIEDLYTAELALGEHARVATELEALVVREPLRERLWELLMIALYRAGRQGDALGAYRRARTALVEELGIEPGRRLRDVEAAILAGRDVADTEGGDETGTAGDRDVAVQSAGSVAVRLPAPLTRLIGREAEVTEVRALLGSRRLVTLTGIGGCGKTRLAIAVADGATTGDEPGPCFVELSALTDPDLVAATVATALGLPERPDLAPFESLSRHLRTERLLLVLDNCEHLVDACAGLVGSLLSRCPEVRVLATSREPLGVPDELVYPVAPLSIPTGSMTGGLAEARRYDAIRLFLDRTAVPVVRDLRDSDAAVLAAICAGLDGLPLAIELAAARTPVLTLREIADRLRDPDLLRTAQPATRRRQDTLDTAMAWSYQLLSPVRQGWFRRLAVFSGGFTLDAVEAVAPSSTERAMDVLADLVARSLVVMERRRDRARYRLLETIRHYAVVRLSESAEELAQAYRCHAAYYRALAEEVDGKLHGPELEQLLDRLTVEHDNLVAAQAWHSRHGSRLEQLRLAAGLARYCHLRGRYRDGRRWLEDALSTSGDEPVPELARACLSAAYLALFDCDYAAATEYGERAVAVHRELGDETGGARSMSLLASVDREQGRSARSLSRYAEALAVYRAAADRRGVADTLLMSGFTSWLTGDLDRAEPLVEAALAEFHQLGDPEGVASARVHLAAVAYYRSQGARARWLAEDALARFREFEFKEGIAWALNMVGLVEHRDGQLGVAMELLRRSLDTHCAVGDRWRAASVLEAMAAVLADGGAAAVLADGGGTAVVPADGGATVAAAELLGAAAAIRDAIGAPVPRSERAAHAATVGKLNRAMTDRAFYAAWARGEGHRLSDLPGRVAELLPVEPTLLVATG